MIEPDHARASELFVAARKLPEDQRPGFLEQACEGDAALRTEVESLLQFDQPTPPFLRADRLRASAREASGGLRAEGSHRETRPKHIGEYEILDILGEGGMGIVYLAKQSNPPRRVALKVIRDTLVSQRAVRRFEHEAEALARLSHPAIARMYEARLESVGGVPAFIAMEYVEGEPLTGYGRDANHTTRRRADQSDCVGPRQRLEMMARICDAVEHAHQRGVIHRDLKPGNILVTAENEPRVLDFGIARLCDESERLRTLQTQTGELVGTLPYMSPEQIDGKSHELDTRTDVYALGLILYELLANRPAFDVSDRSLAHAARIIREEEPAPLASIDRRWRGDVETIVAKAIEKDRTRRYASVGEMAADIRRHLTDRPILARPASHFYQFRKFARRNRAMVAGVSLALAALIAGAALASWQALRASEAARRAEATSEFLRDIFAAIDPYRVGQEVTVAEIVRFAEKNIESSARGQPLLESDLRYELGSIYLNLGLLPEANSQLQAAYRIRSDALGVAHPLSLQVQNSLGLLRIKQGSYAEAEALLREVLAGRKRALGEGKPETLAVMNHLAEAVHAQGRFDEAATLCETALAGQARLLGEAHPETLATQVNLASAFRALGRSSEAERAYRQAIPRLKQVLGAEHPSTLFATANLARLYKDEKRYAEAEPLQREACAGMRTALGEDHPDTLIASANLAQMLWRGGKPAEAEPVYRDVVARMKSVFGENHANVATVSTQFALVLESLGRLDEAQALLTRQLDHYKALYGPENPRTAQVAQHLQRVTQETP